VGQKTHPKGFRLITNQEHLSKWYSNKISYANLLKEDFFIRTTINDSFIDLLSISNIEILRMNSSNEEGKLVNITIKALFPRAKEMYKKITKYINEENFSTSSTKILVGKNNLKKITSLILKKNIRNLIRILQKKTAKDYFIKIQFLKNPFEDATLIAKYIGLQLEKRVPFRRAVKQAIKKVKLTSIKGIKVEVSGRLNGIEIARSEWKRDGKIPLHTLRAKIDYTHQVAYTIYGVIGIKVWLFNK
jgi:small subunit ribosomal protein S3